MLPQHTHTVTQPYTIHIIVAASTNHVIGAANALPWKLPNDMKYFKATTWGMPVIMGRKTMESMGNKPLQGRMNIVLTTQPKWAVAGAHKASSIANAVAIAALAHTKEIYIIGGGELYKQCLPIAQVIHITRVHTTLEGDTYFPVLNMAEWKLTNQQHYQKDEKHNYDYSFEKYECVTP